jgi:hypothetical protein
VSVDGHDRWPGTAHSLRALRPGQTLYVHGGTYQEFISKIHIHPGTRSNPVLVKAVQGERPLVKGAVFLRQPSYWTIDGIDVTADPDQAEVPSALVKLTGGVGWVWRNSEIWGTESGANVLIAGYDGTDEPTKWTFKRNCVHDVNVVGAHRVANLSIGHMSSDADSGRVIRNIFFDVPNGKNIVVGNGRGGPRGLKIKFNTLYGSQIGVSLAGARRVKFARNIVTEMSLGFTVRGKRSSTGRINGHRNVVANNLAIDTVLLRPGMQKVIGGTGNITPVSPVPFDDTLDCAGFHPDPSAPVALPYGRYAIG